MAETIIQRYLPPSVYWLPVNGYRMLPLHGQGPLSRIAQVSLKRAYSGWRLLKPLPSESPDDQRGALFAGPLYGAIHDLLGSTSSAATALLGPAEFAALSGFNDVITRAAATAGIPLIDLRVLCTDAGDYSLLSPIEPSAAGGAKIAGAICRALGEHDFAKGRCAVYV